MANEQNLKPVRSKEEARERGRAGGKRSGEVRRENKLIKDRILERMGETDWNEMINGLIERAKGNDKAFEILRDTIGQKPSEIIEVSGLAEQQSKVDELLNELKK